MDELRLILLIIGIILIIGIYATGRRQEKRFGSRQDNLSALESVNEPYMPEYLDNKEPLAPSSENQILTSLSPETETPQHQHPEKHSTPKAYNIDIERHIEPVSIENWRFRPIETGLESPRDSTDLGKKPERDITFVETESDPKVPVKDPQEHQRFSHLEDSLLIIINVLRNNGANFNGLQLQEAFKKLGLEYGDMRIYHYYPDDSQQRLFSVASIKEPGCFDLENPASFSTKGISLFMLLPGPLEGKLAYEILFGVATDLANKLGGYLCDEDFNKLTKQAIAHMQDKISEFNLHHQKH